MGWFGSIGLAYKYFIVLGSLLVLTVAAGFAKVLYDRRRLKKIVKEQENVEAGKKEEQVELNQRERDQGDLFGIRAIEAGYFGGVAQSRPTSAAGSYVDSPSMSSSTLVGGLNSPRIKSQSPLHSGQSSVATLPLAHLNNRDSDTLPSDTPRRKSPPAMKLRPSEAEISGRHPMQLESDAAVNMNLHVPPSPVHARPPRSPTFDGSDDGESDGQASPRSPSFKPEHYAPVPPQLPMPEGLSISIHVPEDKTKSMVASFNDPSPGPSAPSSPRSAPQTRPPSMPMHPSNDELFFSAYSGDSSVAPSGQSHYTPSERRPSSPIRLLPHTYQPNAVPVRDSVTSSIYSTQRMSVHQHKRIDSSSFNYSFPGNSERNSIALATSNDQGRRPSNSSFIPTASPLQPKDKSDSRPGTAV